MKCKCPRYCCIPYSYVCDGKWDCPKGHDEAYAHKCGVNRPCQGMFKCKLSKICLHSSDVCDKLKECPSGEDQVMCDIQDTCPKVCVCFHYGVACVKIQIKRQNLGELHYVAYYISLTGLQDLNFAIDNIYVQILKLSNNNILSICASVSRIHSQKILH